MKIAKLNSWWGYNDKNKDGSEKYPFHEYDWPPNEVVRKRCEGHEGKESDDELLL